MANTGPFDREEKYKHLSNLHPCLGGEAHSKFGRLHLPVSPTCNIQCKFCKRDCNNNEDRPGVANGILAPKDSVSTVKRALELCPEITVVGIAGPGDTLATENAIETFKYVNEEYPDLIKCLSTNGLLLERYAEELYKVGVSTITVTVNAVDHKIQSQIISHIILDKKIYYGEEAAKILIDAQLRGIRKISELGVIVKVNTVLIPTINDKHIEEIAKTVKEAGAKLYNIIPLIPQHDLSHIPAPTCMELDSARAKAEKYLDVFRHCKHCRADACGIPGQRDLSNQLYGTRLDLETFSHG
ncbi:radical SAM protein [Clostridium felsineum]|uniref:radical SAM protein n=1 Tax=Clostridium felsineum TaxID=36839 RepID=UPI00098C7CCE|nr:radical SAM protein [Clostridium felsineum]URZ18404.1 FeMo cofactor biosynthesis protein NifB [Clostridium felsineum DSM 794]